VHQVIDLHLHILPGVDDGAADLGVAGSMLLEARRQGFTRLVATPHLVERLSEGYFAQVQAALRDLEPLAARAGIELLPGFEVVLTPDLPRRLHWGEPVTLGGSMALLVELPVTVWPTYTEATLFDLQTAGYRPILAHPERYDTLQRDPTRAIRLAEQGIALQVTTGAIAGLFGKSKQRLIEHWMEEGAVSLVASDAHSLGRRMTTVPDALARIERLVGPMELRRLTLDAPHALLNDSTVPLPIITPGKPAHGFKRTVTSWLRR
jgi:protein-tyrosine phosphatase